MADAPPSATARARASRPTGKAEKPKPQALSKSAIADKIAEQVTMAGMVVGAADPVAGFVLLSQAESFGESWANVAAVQPRVKLILERWFQTSVYADAATATVAIALPLATHYGLVPAARFNPARQAVAHMEELVANGTTLDELLAMHKAAQERQEAVRHAFAAAAAAAAANGNGTAPDPEPDHFEAPTT